MTLHIFDHILFVLLVLVFPIIDSFSLRKRAALIEAGRTELRMQLYRKLIREEWIAVLVLAVLWLYLGRGAAELGLIPGTGALVWAGYGLAALICVLLAVQMRVMTANEKNRASLLEQTGGVAFLMPHTLQERRTFDAVSLTAGICEELLFRGFLFAYLTAGLGVSVWLAALLSSVAFGFAHLYQGPLGILKTGTVGLVLAVLYVMTGSLWAPIVVHFLMDLFAGRMTYKAVNETTPENSSPELAAESG